MVMSPVVPVGEVPLMHEWSYRRLSQLVRPYAWTMRTPGHWDGHAMGRTRPLRKRSWMRTRSRARQQQMLGKGGKALKEALTRKDILLRLCAPSIHVRLCRGLSARAFRDFGRERVRREALLAPAEKTARGSCARVVSFLSKYCKMS